METKTCPTCKGTGEIWVAQPAITCEPPRQVCDTCKGTGKIPKGGSTDDGA